VVEERKNLRKSENIQCHLRYGYSVAVNQIVMTIDYGYVYQVGN